MVVSQAALAIYVWLLFIVDFGDFGAPAGNFNLTRNSIVLNSFVLNTNALISKNNEHFKF